MTRLAFVVAVLALASAAPASAHEHHGGKPDDFGAIAYSSATGAYGWSTGYRTSEAAQEAAAGACGAADCAPVVWEKDACAALATSTNGIYGWAWSDALADAETNATSSCANAGGAGCQVVRWICR